MTMTETFACLAGLLALVAALYVARNELTHRPRRWMWPAALSVAMGVFSGAAVLVEGPLGFWHEHSARGLWGNQIWFDLLLCALAALALAMPQARAEGMRRVPWTLLVLMCGSIGLGLFVARLWYLQDLKRAG